MNMVVKDIKSMCEGNMRSVPGFSHYFLSDDGEVFSVKGRNAVRIKPAHGRYFRLCEDGNMISVTLEKLEYCIERNISPALLSRSKLSVARGCAGLKLMDVTGLILERKRAKRDDMAKNIEKFYSENAKWNSLLLLYYQGDKEMIVEIEKMINGQKKNLEAYIKNTLRATGRERVAFIVEECMEEIAQRIKDRSAVIFSPLVYMEKTARRINERIRIHQGVVFCENNVFHVKGCMQNDDGSLP